MNPKSILNHFYILSVMKQAASLLIIIFLAIGLSGCLEASHHNTISKTIDIPYHEGLTSNAGTLFCNGKIVETEQGIESLTLSIMVAATFPSDEVTAFIALGDLLGEDLGSSPEYGLFFRMQPPSSTGDKPWYNAKGEHHVWVSTLTFDSNSIYVTHTADQISIAEYDFETYTIDDIVQGKHDIFSVFASIVGGTGDIHLQTSPFYLVRSGNEFWFE